MAKNTRNYPKSDSESLRDTIQKLKSQVRRLKKENRELKSENQTLLDAWTKTEGLLQEVTEDVPLEELLKCRKLPKKVLRDYEKELEEKLDETEVARKKWANWRKENL